MLDRKWGRVVNLSSAAVAASTTLLGTNAYLAVKAGLEAHTVNLAAELADSGVTAIVYRPGLVDTEMSAFVQQEMRTFRPALAEDVERSRRAGVMLTPEASAAALLAHLDHDETGRIWHVDKTLG
jgi:3-oxoacyl-[acyl-carrier protein] reductase